VHLFRRKNGYFYIRYRDYKKNWKQITTDTRRSREAKKIFLEFLKNYPSNPSFLNKISFSSFSEKYLEYSKVNHSPTNTKRIEYVLNRFKNHIKSAQLNEIDSQTIEEYKSKRLKCCKPCTVNIELRSLKSMFNTAIRWDLIQKNPFVGVKLVRVPKTYPKYLTKEEVELLCDKSKLKWLKNVITFAFNTGMRRNEIINLLWEDVHINQRHLIVKNNETFSTKSKKDRLIPLSIAVIDLLNTLPKQSRYVFTNGPKPKLYPNYVTQCFRDLVRDCGFPKGISFHSLRHSFASNLVAKGASLYVVKELLGHSDISTTQIYSHLQQENLRKAIDLL
jgi:site-specific recombinase XerD